jgi:hypothetical protein
MKRMQDSKVSAAIKLYDALASDVSLAASTHEQLQRGMQQRELEFGGRYLCEILRPYFLDAGTVEDAMRGANLVTNAFIVACRRAASDAEFRKKLEVPAWIEGLLELEGDTDLPSVVGRLDGLWGPDGRIRFIEYNPMPVGIMYTAELSDIFQETSLMQRVRERVTYRAIDPRQGLDRALATLDSRIAAWRSSSPARPTSIAFVEFVFEKSKSELSKLFQFIEGRGTRVYHAAFKHEWAYRDGRLFLAGEPIDFVSFVLPQLSAAFLQQHGAGHPIFQAVRNRAAHVLSGLYRNAMLFMKSLLAAINDPGIREPFRLDFDPAVDDYLPWTRLLRPGKTRYEGQEIDLLPFVAANRERFILKPSEGMGGAGIVRGWDASAEEWSATLEKAKTQLFVVQERIPMVAVSYPVFQDGQVEHELRYSDFCPYVWNDEFALGALVRIARDGLLNVTAGTGSLAPLYVLE